MEKRILGNTNIEISPVGLGCDMVETIKCTACRYCVEGCPQNIPIPDVFAARNHEAACPQHLDLRKLLEEAPAGFDK